MSEKQYRYHIIRFYFFQVPTLLTYFSLKNKHLCQSSDDKICFLSKTVCFQVFDYDLINMFLPIQSEDEMITKDYIESPSCHRNNLLPVKSNKMYEITMLWFR